MGKKVIVNH